MSRSLRKSSSHEKPGARKRIQVCDQHRHTDDQKRSSLYARTTPTTHGEKPHTLSQLNGHTSTEPPHTHTHTLAPISTALANPYTAHAAVAIHRQKLLTHPEDFFFFGSPLLYDRIYCHHYRRKAPRANTWQTTPRWRRHEVLYSESWIASLARSSFAQVGDLRSDALCGTFAHTPTFTAHRPTVKT